MNTTDTSFNRAAYNNTTNRDNLFNDTDFFYKVYTGPIYHSIAFGTEFGTSGWPLRPQHRDIPEWDEHRGG